MKIMSKTIINIFSALLVLILVNISYAGDSGTYIGFKTGASIQDYNDVKFENPRITGVSQDNDSDAEAIISFQVGKTLSSFPVRLEIEYAFTGEVIFDRFHTPFPTTRQRIIVDSKRIMFNAYHDRSFSLASVYVGAGIGLAINNTDALQGDSDNFNDKNVRSLAWSLGAGVTKNVFTNYTLDLGYRYVDLGAADTNKSEFAPNDEQFKGYLDTHEITAGLRYNF
jgi:opacity protein-like surface antigen